MFPTGNLLKILGMRGVENSSPLGCGKKLTQNIKKFGHQKKYEPENKNLINKFWQAEKLLWDEITPVWLSLSWLHVTMDDV